MVEIMKPKKNCVKNGVDKMVRQSKEIKDIANAIGKYVNKHKDNAVCHASFMAFKGKDCKVVDDILFAFGDKATLKIDLEEMLKAVKKEKEDFVEW